MKGPQHYAEAERLLDFADSAAGRGTGEAEQAIAVAQVHATLAAAAALIEASDNAPKDGQSGGGFLERYSSTWVGGKDGEEVYRPASPWAHAFEGTL